MDIRPILTAKHAVIEERKSKLKAELPNLPIVILGSGNLGKKIAAFLTNNNLNFVGFADNNSKRWGQTDSGIPVMSPSEAFRNYPTALFVVSIWSPNNPFEAIKEQLTNIGIQNIVHAAMLAQVYPSGILPHYQFQTTEYFLSNIDKIQIVYDLLEDNESKSQYLAHADCHMNLNFAQLPSPDVQHQYFPSGVVEISEGEVFFDAGAFDGDTLKSLLAHSNGKKFKKYIALEPDPINRVKLESVIDSLQLENVDVYPFAVGSETCTLQFDATGGGSAGFSNQGTTTVQCVTIDEQFYNEPISFLKFDIEGAELGALKGAKETIARFRPKIAICIYHLPDDIWTIPLYINEHFPGYKLYARTHQFDGLDFVLYAIPG